MYSAGGACALSLNCREDTLGWGVLVEKPLGLQGGGEEAKPLPVCPGDLGLRADDAVEDGVLDVL